MTLRLIGAGLPRTGTSSLRHLLDAPIYHMSEAFAHPAADFLLRAEARAGES